jgi:hypothetical protein
MGGGGGSCVVEGAKFVVIRTHASAPKVGKVGVGGMVVVKL